MSLPGGGVAMGLLGRLSQQTGTSAATVAHLNVQQLVSRCDVAKRRIPVLSTCVHLLLALYSFLASKSVIIYFTILRHKTCILLRLA